MNESKHETTHATTEHGIISGKARPDDDCPAIYVTTEQGIIRAEARPDDDYPAIHVFIPGKDGEQLAAVVEFDSRNQSFRLQAYDETVDHDEPIQDVTFGETSE